MLWIFSQETMSSTSAVRRVCTASDLSDVILGFLQEHGLTICVFILATFAE